MKKLSIKNTHADALYWATSKQSKNKSYHITRTQEAVLRKLIHYSKKNASITYSNSVISQHTFIGEETLRKNIPILAKKGYISTACMKISDGGQIRTRRTILIKWNFLEKVLADIPMIENDSNDVNTKNDEQVIQIEKPDEQKTEEPISKSDVKKDIALPRVEITDEKLDWLKSKLKNPLLSKEDFNLLNLDELYKLFYGDEGIWHINKDSMENHHGIKLTHKGGSIGTLYNNKTDFDRISVNVGDLFYLMNQIGITFKDFTPEMYKTIKNFGLNKRPKSA